MIRRNSAKTQLLLEIYQRLYSIYGVCACPLTHRNPYELLVAVVLSAQCTDARVNVVTPEFFRKYPTPEALADAQIIEVEQILRPVGLYHAKTLNLINAAKRIVEFYNCTVPNTMEALITLSGVGRKTANVILGNAFDTPGFPVDTHVKRVLGLIGISPSTNPVKLEALVNLLVPPGYWTNLSHLLIWHGRNTCHARRPDCCNCNITDLCKGAGCKNKKAGGKK